VFETAGFAESILADDRAAKETSKEKDDGERQNCVIEVPRRRKAPERDQ
jgi:hypothetical protein